MGSPRLCTCNYMAGIRAFSAHLPLTSLSSPSTTAFGLFVYFVQVNTGVSFCLDYVEDIREFRNVLEKTRFHAKLFRALHGTLFLFGTDGYSFQVPRLQVVRGYGFHIIAVGAWMVPEKLGLLRSGLRSLVKSAVWLRRCGLRFQVKSKGRFRSGLHSTSFFPN